MHGNPKQLWSKRSELTKGGNRRYLVIGTIIVVLLGLAIYFFSGAQHAQRTGRNRFAADGPVPVLAVPARKADVPVYLDAVGTIKALNTVTISPQVDGKLLSVGFKEGQDVKKGDVLARIDPVIYQAQLDQAVAKKAQDEAQLANAKIDLERYERLAATNAINRQQADTQRALVAQYDALTKADQAAMENAQATLSYTTITAPIDGRAGIRQVDEGNIVRAAGTTSIVVLTQLKPISVLFNLPQQNLAVVNTAFAKGPLTVEALRSDDDSVIDRGTLQVVNNQVDQTTGTVQLKAEFPNTDLQLWPGQFVNVRLLIDVMKQVVVIPTGAVQRGPKGTFVFVAKDDAATIRPITVAKQDETQAVVSSGVEPPEQVITTGFARLTEGSKIKIDSGDGASTTPTQAAPARGGQRGQSRRQQQRSN